MLMFRYLKAHVVLKVGSEAEFTGHMFEVTLAGPGYALKTTMVLQNDLDDKMDGVFLKRGQYILFHWQGKNGIFLL